MWGIYTLKIVYNKEFKTVVNSAVFSCTLLYLLNMAKIFRKNGLSENSFEASPGGSSGTLNYGNVYGTPAGGNTTQNSDKFKSSNSSTQNAGHFKDNIEETGSKMPERPDRMSSSGAPIHPAEMSDKGDFENSGGPGEDSNKPNTIKFGSTSELPDDNSSTTDPDTKDNEYYPDGNDDETPDSRKGEPPGRSGDISPGGKYQNAVSNKPIDPTKGLDKQVDKIFTKKITPTPDDVLSALQYELSQMVKKDKYIAKQVVLKNIKQDPKYYSRLKNLNIDDDTMMVSESNIMSEDIKKTTIEKTKNVLDQMISERQKKKTPIKNSTEINGIFKELWDRRQGFKNRK